jgi:hypothetical protein
MTEILKRHFLLSYGGKQRMMLMIVINIFTHRLYLWGSVLSVPLAGSADGGEVRFNRLSGGTGLN